MLAHIQSAFDVAIVVAIGVVGVAAGVVFSVAQTLRR